MFAGGAVLDPACATGDARLYIVDTFAWRGPGPGPQAGEAKVEKGL